MSKVSQKRVSCFFLSTVSFEFFDHTGNARRIIDLWKNRQVRLCLSKAILDEYVEVLQRMGLKDQQELKELLSLFAKGYHLTFTAKTPRIKVVQEDPDDDKFIECAVALHAEVIVTGDKAL